MARGDPFLCISLLLLFVVLSNIYSIEGSLEWTLAFETQGTDEIPFTVVGFLAKRAESEPIHQEITKEALPFIEPWMLKEINKGHQLADFVLKNQFNAAFHFDNCQFGPSTQNINNIYDEILVTLNT